MNFFRPLMLATCLAGATLTSTLGCSSSSQTQSGTAPTLSALAYQPAQVGVGVAATVSGSFTFADPEGDVFQLAMELRPQSGPAQTLPRSEIQAASGVKSGQLQFALMLQAPSAQKVDFSVWVVDRAGNESNRLTGSIDAK